MSKNLRISGYVLMNTASLDDSGSVSIEAEDYGYHNYISIIESFQLLEKLVPRNFKFAYDTNNRVGDHIVYYSDLSLMKKHYPGWNISKSLENIFEEIIEAWQMRLS